MRYKYFMSWLAEVDPATGELKAFQTSTCALLLQLLLLPLQPLLPRQQAGPMALSAPSATV